MIEAAQFNLNRDVVVVLKGVVVGYKVDAGAPLLEVRFGPDTVLVRPDQVFHPTDVVQRKAVEAALPTITAIQETSQGDYGKGKIEVTKAVRKAMKGGAVW